MWQSMEFYDNHETTEYRHITYIGTSIESVVNLAACSLSAAIIATNKIPHFPATKEKKLEKTDRKQCSYPRPAASVTADLTTDLTTDSTVVYIHNNVAFTH